MGMLHLLKHQWLFEYCFMIYGAVFHTCWSIVYLKYRNHKCTAWWIFTNWVHPHSQYPQHESQHIQHPPDTLLMLLSSHSPQPGQSLSYFLVLPGFDLYMNGIIQYFPFHIWLFSLFTMFVRFIHVVTCYNILLYA